MPSQDFLTGMMSGFSESYSQARRQQQDQQIQREELKLRQQLLNSQDKLTKLKIEQAEREFEQDPAAALEKLATQFPGLREALGGGPAPVAGGGGGDLRSMMTGPAEAMEPAASGGAPSYAAPPAGPVRSGAPAFVPDVSVNLGSGTRLNLRGQAPPESIQKASRIAVGFGYQPGSPEYDDTVTNLLAADMLPPKAQARLLARLKEGAPIGNAIAEAIEESEAAEVTQAGAVAGEKARAGIEPAATRARRVAEETTTPKAATAAAIATATAGPKADAAATTAGASGRAKREVAMEPGFAVLDQFDALLPKIKLPKTGGGRLRESPRLAAESLSQSNKDLVAFETLKEGTLATFLRALGEVGTFTEGDISRARSLVPVVTPGPGRLPDTEEVAKFKLKQLRKLFESVAGRSGSSTKAAGPIAINPTTGAKLQFDGEKWVPVE